MSEPSPNPTSRPFAPNDSYDIIFCGGGTSACVAAGRLAAADPLLQILIIERGKSNLGDAQIDNPLLMLANMAPGSKAMIWYHAEAEENLNNKPRVLSTGGVLGGGSSVNAMMYSRAQKVDFESFGVEGWGWEDCLRCAKKVCSYQ
jgi:alcohol oxidase